MHGHYLPMMRKILFSQLKVLLEIRKQVKLDFGKEVTGQKVLDICNIQLYI